MASDREDINLTSHELHVLSELDSRQFGFLKLKNPENAKTRIIVVKAIKYLEQMIIQARLQQEHEKLREGNECMEVDSIMQGEESIGISIDPKTYCKLGHFHLLLEDFAKAMSAYQKFYKLEPENWKDPLFLYGLGICYYHFNAFEWADEALKRALYVCPGLTRAADARMRLALAAKVRRHWAEAKEHLRRAALAATSPAQQKGDITLLDVKFCAAHLLEARGRVRGARAAYEQLAREPRLPAARRGDACRQLGRLQLRGAVGSAAVGAGGAPGAVATAAAGAAAAAAAAAARALQLAGAAEPAEGAGLYLLGRCFAAQGKVHDAFVAYRNSVEKSEGNADTWCSIGVLYQQQNQPMDALQAYICAVQLDKSHSAAWSNLGALYEGCAMARDAFACYANGAAEREPALARRVAFLRARLAEPRAPHPSVTGKRRQLPSIEEAWNLPISAEMSSRHPRAQQQSGAPPPYPAKKAKRENGEETAPEGAPAAAAAPGAGLAPQQLQMLQMLQRNAHALAPKQRALMRQLLAQAQQGAALQPKAEPKLEPKSEPEAEAEAAERSREPLDRAEEEASAPRHRSADVKPPLISADRKEPIVKLEPLQRDAADPPLYNIYMTAKQVCDAAVSEAEAERRGFGGGPAGPEGAAWSTLGPDAPPPRPPAPPAAPLSAPQLRPPAPSVLVDSKRDAFSPHLQDFCLKHPVAVLRGLAAALKLDLGLFSTKTLVEAWPEHSVEVRTQRMQSPDENWDAAGRRRVWACASHRSHTTVRKYAQYQAASFREGLREEREPGAPPSDSDSRDSGAGRRGARRPGRVLRFGTNVDLSDERKWRPQLAELQKLPAFARVASAANMLSHVGHAILGMNTVQLYMKVPGSRTPGHQENNNFCSVNVNIGPGECEWFAVPDAYWGAVRERVEEHGLSYLHGSWWPDPEELRARGVPVYRFTQRPGDLVWVNAGCVHWVQAQGWCNNVAWNVGPLTARQFELALERYEWNKAQAFKSIVPMVQLTWNLARNIRVSDARLWERMRACMAQSLRAAACAVAAMRSRGAAVRHHGRARGEASHYCGGCEREVWHALLVRAAERRHVVHCLSCARRADPSLASFLCLEEHDMEELRRVFDAFALHRPAAAPLAALVRPPLVPPPQLSPSLVPPPLVSPATVAPPLVSPALVSPALVSPALVPPPLVSPALVPPPLVSPARRPALADIEPDARDFPV